MRLTRRQAIIGATSLAAPAIIGRALVSSARPRSKVENLIVVRGRAITN